MRLQTEHMNTLSPYMTHRWDVCFVIHGRNATQAPRLMCKEPMTFSIQRATTRCAC